MINIRDLVIGDELILSHTEDARRKKTIASIEWLSENALYRIELSNTVYVDDTYTMVNCYVYFRARANVLCPRLFDESIDTMISL